METLIIAIFLFGFGYTMKDGQCQKDVSKIEIKKENLVCKK